ncbi:hypothetical protein TRFO_18255 [Tritrichomonas foetus]|uniref:Uncharacterized protein n=1 Tax=Tritrichomonas foetus TaxID=1144522 RepID=A0A1J4KLF7_9EUKA|nr:hypothetical protein TRFO_18255 [Tritrichomonas foetus]|eukprot:OHT12059.1 hypothetical protein TRFO_18255 [Tritrichomonas foetus]
MCASQLDLKALKAGTGSAFLQQLANVPKNLNENNLKSFYSECFDLFDRKDLSNLTMSQVLSAITKSLSTQGNLEAFIDWRYPEKLPFKKFFLQEQILDLIYIIVFYAPRGMNRETSKLFGHLIGRYTRKCLTIFSVFAERFQIVLNPWPMVDLLFKYNDYFCHHSCINDYVTILVYLNQTFLDFREARQQHSWNAVCQAIERTNILGVKVNCYYALCHLYEANPLIVSSYQFPQNAADHLFVEELQHPVLSLLFRVPPNGVTIPVIKALFKLSSKNQSAFLALAKLAENRTCAIVLARDLSWLNHDTARIFAKILSFTPLRREVMRHNELITFLNSLASSKNTLDLVVASTFVRRLPLDQRFVLALQKGRFFQNYFESSLKKRDNGDASRALLQLVSVTARKAEVKEYTKICGFVSDMCRQGDINAIRAAVALARYNSCAVVFQKESLDDYFESHKNDSHSAEFLANFRKGLGGKPAKFNDTPPSKPIEKKKPSSSSSSSEKEEAPKQDKSSEEASEKSEEDRDAVQPEVSPIKIPKDKKSKGSSSSDENNDEVKEAGKSSSSSESSQQASPGSGVNSPPVSPRINGDVLPRPSQDGSQFLPGTLPGALASPPPPSRHKE